jgi:transposase-like protein
VCRRWKDVHHAQGVPQRVPRGRDPGLQGLGLSIAQVAKDIGISPSCLKRWLTIDERKSANPSPAALAANESDALREANKRIKLLEQENEVLRRAAAYLSQANLPGK